MQNCPHCATDNPDDALYCRGCGRQLPREIACPTCGRLNTLGSRFCNRCGGALSSGQAPRVRAAGAVVTPLESTLPAPSTAPSSPASDGARRLPVEGEWSELSRLVNELSTEPAAEVKEVAPVAVVPSPPPAVSLPDEPDEPEQIGLRLAPAMTGNGPGPRLLFRMAPLPRLDGDKATGLMASALAAAAGTSKIARKRQPWRETDD